MADVWIDSNWTGAGTAGTLADPFKTLTAAGMDTRDGDQSADTIYLKRGSNFIGEGIGTGTPGTNDMTNVTITAYGDSSLANPIIDVNYAEINGIRLGGTDVHISHITIKQSDKYGIFIVTGTDNVTIDDVTVGDNPDASEPAPNGMQLSGTSAGTKLTNLVVSNCTIQNTGNNSIEMSHVDGALFTDCLAHDAKMTGSVPGGNGYEMWDSTTDVTFLRCKVYNTVTGFKAFRQSSELHPNVTIRNCSAWNILSQAIFDEAGNGWVIENNTCHNTGTAPCITIGTLTAGYTGHTLKGNIFYCAGSPGGNEVASFFSGVTFTGGCNNNVYHTDLAPPRWRWNGSVLSNLSNYIAAATPSETNSLETDPLFTDLANFDLSLTAVSPGLYETLDAGTGLTGDINNNLRYGGVDVGAHQFQRHPDISVSLTL